VGLVINGLRVVQDSYMARHEAPKARFLDIDLFSEPDPLLVLFVGGRVRAMVYGVVGGHGSAQRIASHAGGREIVIATVDALKAQVDCGRKGGRGDG
jgi:hypothetical protein